MLDSKGVKILDKERDRFSLSHTWDRALVSVPQRLSRDSEIQVTKFTDED